MIWLSIFLLFVSSLLFYLMSVYKDTTDKKFCVILGCFSTAGMFVFFLFSFFTVVPVGHLGIQVIFGKASSNVLESGLVIKNPFGVIKKLDARYKTILEDVSIPSKDKLTLNMKVSLMYRIDTKIAYQLFKEFGIDYEQKLVLNQFTSSVRDVTALHPMEAFFSDTRETIVKEITNQFEGLSKAKGIITEQIMLLDVDPPQMVTTAIEKKMELEQQAEQMKFTLEKEMKEAERKRIEAQGIADFQRIVTEGINDNLLKWKGIEATQELAKSPNSKMVIIGGKDGLPLILNNQ